MTKREEGTGVEAGVLASAEGELEPQVAIAAYETFERLVACLEGALKGVYVRLTGKECKLVLEGEQVALPQDLAEACQATWEDDALYATIPLGKGGEQP